MNSFATDYKTRVDMTLGKIPLHLVDRAIDWVQEARNADRQIFVCGNGGSASTASHFVCDMVKGASYQKERRFRILALTDSLPTLTAYSNDVSYDAVFVEQLKNFAQTDDVFIGISGSGNSANVIRAMEYANSAGLKTVALTGRDGGQLGPLAQLQINVAEPHMGRIEDAHMIICHMIAYHFMERDR